MLVRTREALSALFWSASLEPTSEFTPEDPIAFDYLNRMVGNWLFPGFTTRTSRANYYVMVLYGLGAVEEQLTSRMEPMTDANVEELFERFERFWAMSLAAHYKGVIPNDESIRGLRGVQRTFRTGVDDAYPLDYRLISRQTELGALGAYLTSLRHHHLVEDGGFRATSLGRELGRQFFATLQENKFAGQYDAFVSWALDLDNKVAPAKLGSVTIAKVGEQGRLGRIRERAALQEALYRVLFAESPDESTRELHRIVIDAWAAGDDTARAVLEGIVSGKYAASESLREKARIAAAFALASGAVRDRFDALFRLVEARGARAKLEDVLPLWADSRALTRVRAAASKVFECPNHSEFGRLPVHGAAFLQLLRYFEDADPGVLLRELLRYHESVQRERRRGAGWIKLVGDQIQVDVATYNPPELDWENWADGFKFPMIRTLLHDVGVLG